ncbi:MAG: GAP family protein [Acidimicrobiales bacterium]|nr:GAP family protein [Acidimicrobiales bacterium]MCB1015056.1 GAP family protein [Acidimicrobiales bacterium]MCB9372612.1 GAP family protein [Microthrixaceae bacterium]
MLASALTQAIGGALAPAVGVALSPIPIVAVILMLGTPQARRDGPAFALGWVVGLSVVAGAVLVLTGASGDAADPTSSTADSINWMQVGLGAVLLVLAKRQWQKRPAPGAEPELPTWMARIDELPPGKALGAGVLLSAVNPKNLVLTLAAAASIAQVPDLSGGGEAVAAAVFVLVASLTVVGAVVAYLVGGRRAEGLLASVKQYMAAHNAAIMMVILLILGAKLLGEGVGALG